MTDSGRKQDRADLRPAYDPPRALSLSDMGTGSGGATPCDLPGSGAAGACGTGLSADESCGSNGSSAFDCVEAGNGAVGCFLGGNTPQDPD